MNLKDWGWSSWIERKVENIDSNNLEVGRVIKENRHRYRVVYKNGEIDAEVSGNLIHRSLNKSDFPTVGDWVLLKTSNDLGIIDYIIDRKSRFSRKVAGIEVSEQVIAANFDYLFIVFGLEGGRNWSESAVERFLTRAWDSGAEPVIILNKSDLSEDPYYYKTKTEEIAAGVNVFLTSALNGDGLDPLKEYLIPGKTVAFTGYSGVGKSALVNSLCGYKLMVTGDIRESDLKGKHTTTHKELVKLDSGALLIDSPGLKELQLWGNEDSLAASFSDIYELAKDCKFSDCTHSGEPDCNVNNALESGELDSRRFDNFLKMKKELKYLERKTSVKAALEEKAKWKQISKFAKSFKK